MRSITYYSTYANVVASDGRDHPVTIVGKLIHMNVPEYGYNSYTLDIGIAICHPDDYFSYQEGIHIAKSKIDDDKEIATMTWQNDTMATPTVIKSILIAKLADISNTIDDYIH
jgi:hypothetical protein